MTGGANLMKTITGSFPRAIYTKDPIAVESVFSKYDIRYILLDENVISRDNNRSLYIDETKALISQIPTVTVAQSFGNITVYERNYKTLQSFVSLKTNLPTVSPTYKWTDNDVAYQELGDYIADESCHVSRVACRVFPFRSLLRNEAWMNGNLKFQKPTPRSRLAT